MVGSDDSGSEARGARAAVDARGSDILAAAVARGGEHGVHDSEGNLLLGSGWQEMVCGGVATVTGNDKSGATTTTCFGYRKPKIEVGDKDNLAGNMT